jgi:hypothetical protein
LALTWIERAADGNAGKGNAALGDLKKRLSIRDWCCSRTIAAGRKGAEMMEQFATVG